MKMVKHRVEENRIQTASCPFPSEVSAAALSCKRGALGKLLVFKLQFPVSKMRLYSSDLLSVKWEKENVYSYVYCWH